MDLVVAPGVLTLTGVFGKVAEETELGGWVLGAWIVFYLAQLAWVMVVVSKAAGHTRMGWIFIASLLPWAVSWAPAYGWGWGLLWIGIAGAIAAVMMILALRTFTLETWAAGDRDGGQGAAQPHECRHQQRLHPPTGAAGDPGCRRPAYEAVLPMLCEIGTSPAKGDTFPLRIDPKNPKHLALDPGLGADD